MTPKQAMLELVDYLKEHSDRLTTCLDKEWWKPSRSHIEGARNAFVSAENTLRQSIRSAQQAEAGEIGEQQILDEANRRYPQDGGSHRRAFIEGAGWGLNNRPAPVLGAGAREAEKSAQYIIEGIILRRLHEKRVEGYTLEMSKEIAAALADTVTETGGRGEGKPTDKERLDFLDRCNARLNAEFGTSYSWKLILNHNVNRLMLGHMRVDLADSHANGLPSCRDAIDAEIMRVGASLSSTERWTDDELGAAKAEAKKLHDYFHPQDGGGK